ncbi:MAG TPA: hypothetical protein DDZ81_12355 [Acetobacteraceae bacterium]|jgi:hypothetical protein|nr:hypothetical protein [Acetobacteraceae bacterium]
MRALIVACLLTVSLGACGSLPATEQTPFIPPGVFGTYQDVDTGAISFAAWAFASPANTRENPAEAARAVVALEYLPGELKESPRWIGVDDSVIVRLEQARMKVRAILGIRPDAPPQLVVNAMLALGLNLQSGNQAAAMQVLTSPVFTFPPEQTLGILSNLPYIKEANLATARAESGAEASLLGGTGR